MPFGQEGGNRVGGEKRNKAPNQGDFNSRKIEYSICIPTKSNKYISITVVVFPDIVSYIKTKKYFAQF